MDRDYVGIGEVLAVRVERGGQPLRYCALDLDGVLVDTDALHEHALNAALQNFGVFISHEEHLSTFKGLPTKVKCGMLTLMGRLPEHAHPWVSKLKQEGTLAAIELVVQPDPAKRALLEAMVRDGWRLAICSNCVRETVDALVRAVGVGDLVDFTLSNEDVPAAKPAPDIYLTAAERYGIAPRDLVVVEDAPRGREAALAAGCRLVAVEGPDDVGPGLLARLCAAADGVRDERK